MVIENFILVLKIGGVIMIGIILMDLAISLTDLLHSYSELLKKEKEYTENKKNNTPSFGDKLEYATALINTITILANIEVSSKIQSLALIDTQYDIRRLDTDITEICSTIFNGIKDDSFNGSTILTNDFLMHEIYEIVSMTLMEKMNELNQSIIKSVNINK